MSREPVSQSEPDIYDVYISYARADAAWADHLGNALSELGLRCFFDISVQAGDSWGEILNRALDSSGALVVLWSPAASQSEGVRAEIAQFEALSRSVRDERLLIPVVLGGRDVLQAAPSALASRQALVLKGDAYATGPEAAGEEWNRAIRDIARALQRGRARAAEPPLKTTTTLPTFSASSRRALTYASHMLGKGSNQAVRLRTAALLGALREAAASGMAPTTGDVVRLVLDRQERQRTVEEILSAAATAAGLDPIGDTRLEALTMDVLATSNVGDLVQDAVIKQRQSGAASVHLRHILATGVHAMVSREALRELSVTMPELRTKWRASIARTWPEESQEGWDEILRESEAPVGFGAPPSARVHADRWTVEDRLDYALYAKAIAEFIRHPDARPPMVISVQGPWGQGKTSLMRMIQSDLDPDHPDLQIASRRARMSAIVEPPSELTFGDLRDSLDGSVTVANTKPATIRTVWFNAWKYQSSDQIWAGLAHAILGQLPARLPAKAREVFWLRLQLRRIDPSAVREDIYKATLERFLPRLAGRVAFVLGAVVVGGLYLLVEGFGAVGVGVVGGGFLTGAWAARRAWAKATRGALERHLEGAYLRYVRQPDYAGKLGYLHLVEEDMTRALELLTPDDQPVVIFIDDLDRCSPAKIGEVIEGMNLFLAGDYPNCAFVIGVDAEVVAASMEVLHSEIIDKLGDRRGELGWRFMDKFVQLPFVMPRLQDPQREAYLRGLFATPKLEQELQMMEEAEQLESDVANERLPVDELARRVGELASRLVAVAPERARALGENVVAAGARAFSDSDPEVIQALADQLRYLSDNPRTIKRAVNLYRFHRFAAFARQASTLPLEAATPAQIGRWIVVIIRWPHFVRWLQAQRDEQGPASQDPATRVLELAGNSDTLRAFTKALAAHGIDASWTDDEELWKFLRVETHPDLKLDLAGERGLW